MCVNGAADHLVTSGDIIIIASFIQLEDERCKAWNPTVVFVNDNNQIKEIRAEKAALLFEEAVH